tara:strand:+ start:296 stop:622 length:327 start_codon:yes stop_codon:yes gene_type:complete
MRKKFGNGNIVKGGQEKLDVAPPIGVLNKKDFKALGDMNKKAGGGMIRQMYKKGKSVKKGYHKTKDGRTVKKGLYYYMNKRKKSGTSRKGKGTVTDKALKRSAKTAKA